MSCFSGGLMASCKPWTCWCGRTVLPVLLSQALLQTVAVISFSLFSLPEEERSIISEGHRLQGSSVSNFQCVNSLCALLSSFPARCLVLSVVVNVAVSAQIEKSFMALGLLTLVPGEGWDRTTLTLSGALINNCFLCCLSR